MATLLGSPYNRGKADITRTYKTVGAETGTSTQLEEGLVVGLSGDRHHVAIGGTPIGVVGMGRGKVSVAVVVSGESVWAQADDALNAPVIGSAVFVTPQGKISDTDNSGANTAVTAVFADTEVRTDGAVTNIKGAEAYNRKCVCISFLGGM